MEGHRLAQALTGLSKVHRRLASPTRRAGMRSRPLEPPKSPNCESKKQKPTGLCCKSETGILVCCELLCLQTLPNLWAASCYGEGHRPFSWCFAGDKHAITSAKPVLRLCELLWWEDAGLQELHRNQTSVIGLQWVRRVRTQCSLYWKYFSKLLISKCSRK